MTKIFYFTTVEESPTGGTKQQFRHVDVLRRNGYEAFIVKENPETLVRWLPKSCPVLSLNDFPDHYDARDFVVLPETAAARKFGSERKVMFNQNAFQSFFFFELRNEKPSLYQDPLLEAMMVTSEHNREVMKYFFPGLRVEVIPNSVDPAIFKPGHKRKRISFFARKNQSEVEFLANALVMKGLSAEWEIFPIEGKSEGEVASILAETAIYVHLGYPEGLSLSVMEAMLCGCYVVGYHGFGDIEYMKEEFCVSLPCADVFRLLLETEKAAKEYSENPDRVRSKAAAGREFMLKNYSMQREEQAIVGFWKSLI